MTKSELRINDEGRMTNECHLEHRSLAIRHSAFVIDS